MALMAIILLASCQRSDINRIKNGVITIKRCCSELKPAATKTFSKPNCEATEQNEDAVANAPLPAYHWDNKLTLW